MEITDKKAPTSLEAYIKNIDARKKVKATAQPPVPAADNSRDKVELSDEAKLIQSVNKILKSLPEIREEKIAQIRQQIESGSYQIDTKKIAVNMLKAALADEDS